VPHLTMGKCDPFTPFTNSKIQYRLITIIQDSASLLSIYMAVCSMTIYCA